MPHHRLLLPDMELEGPIRLGLWLARLGRRVVQGDPIVEVAADGVVIDLPAPADGVLCEILAEEDEPICIGQPLAVIDSDGL